jgi:hypothetical protein
MQVEARHSPVLCINAPEWYQESDFNSWLNSNDEPLMTWHERGNAPSEWSDVIVFVDPSLSGEGSDSDSMPAVYWEFIVKTCRERFPPSTGLHIIVRITNLQE